MIDVAGKPFPEILHNAVLGPAGMTHSTYRQPLPETLRAKAAQAYRSDGKPVEGGWHTYPGDGRRRSVDDAFRSGALRDRS